MKGMWYVGEGRYELALWNGLLFVTIGSKLGGYVEMTMEYGERGFSPLKQLTKEMCHGT